MAGALCGLLGSKTTNLFLNPHMYSIDISRQSIWWHIVPSMIYLFSSPAKGIGSIVTKPLGR